MIAFICLGRLGDCLSLLPLCWRFNQQDQRVTLVVSKDYASVLESVSCTDCLTFDGDYGDVQGALEFCRKRGIPDARVAQCHGNPRFAQPECESYQLENYRLAGALNEFGKWPLVMDRRDAQREAELLAKVRTDKPLILVGVHGLSSPFEHGGDLLALLRAEFGETHAVVDLAGFKAERIYDFLALMDRAACLVSVDTMWLHLARASKVPVVALCNDGWRGSVPPPTTIECVRYGDYQQKREHILAAVHHAVNSPKPKRIVHSCDIFGTSPRHDRAMSHWLELYARDVQAGWQATDKLRDLLLVPGADLVIWGNDDNWFDVTKLDEVVRHACLFGACSIRRPHEGNSTHVGRDCFVLSGRWLNEHGHEIPDYRPGGAIFDIGMAALIRKTYGIETCRDNLALDMFPAELPPGFVLHEAHPSGWHNNHTLIEHNRRVFRESNEKLAMEVPV